jgi:hypothetical protein
VSPPGRGGDTPLPVDAVDVLVALGRRDRIIA